MEFQDALMNDGLNDDDEQMMAFLKFEGDVEMKDQVLLMSENPTIEFDKSKSDYSITDCLSNSEDLLASSTATLSPSSTKTNDQTMFQESLQFLDPDRDYAFNRSIENELGALTFGRKYESDSVKASNDLSIVPSVNFQEIQELISENEKSLREKYKYKLYLGETPSKSRVETQIKCRLIISENASESLLHLPTDTIARPRFQLRDTFKPSPSILDLSIDVISANDPERQILLCDRCTNRERKRAFRKKNLDSNEEYHWNDDRPRRLAIFNCREVVAFSQIKTCQVEDNHVVKGKEVELPLRLACYCRHHDAKSGFRVIFTITDHTGQVVARQISRPVIITDDHKDSKFLNNSSLNPLPSGMVSIWSSSSQPLSPTSMEESSTTSDGTKPVKRRRGSDWASDVQMYESAHSTPGSSRRLNLPSPQSSDNIATRTTLSAATSPSSAAHVAPSIQRIIPSQGSIRGGIDVTILGSGFHNGLVTMFGDSKSFSTHCWSDSTIVTTLPAASVPGPVVVTFEGFALRSPQVFTYIDDTDRQLIELALQVVGLKMNGKLEDARNIAMRIVGRTDNDGQNAIVTGTNDESVNHEKVVLKCIEVANVNDVVERNMPNWQLKSSEGQTMLHLAAALGYAKVVVVLINHGARVDVQDNNGMTPLHFAALHGHVKVVEIFLKCHADPLQRNNSGQLPIEIAKCNTKDVLPAVFNEYFAHTSRTNSSSSISSVWSTRRARRIYADYGSSSDGWAGDDDNDSSEYDSESSDEEDHHLSLDDELLVRHFEQDGRRSVNELTAYKKQTEPLENQYQNNTTAQNISTYISQFSANARNKIHWDFSNWDDVLNYISINGSRRAKKDPVQDQHSSDSDTTVTAKNNNIQKMWNYFRPSANVDKAPPPRYEEIFPEKTSSHPTDGKQKFDGAVEGPSDVNYEQEYLMAWSTKRKQLRNDRMLFFFWLPVLLLTVSYFMYSGKLPISMRYTAAEINGEQSAIKQYLSNFILGRKPSSPVTEKPQ